MKRNKVVKSLNNSNKNKTKAINLQNFNGEPFILNKMKGSCWGANKWRLAG